MTRVGLRRSDGPATLTGAARYTADQPALDALIAVLVTSTIPNGRLVDLDIEAALGAPGVSHVLDHHDMPRLVALPSPPMGYPAVPLQSDRIHYKGEPVAVVLASTLQQAQHAAGFVRARYVGTKPARVFGRVEDVRPEQDRPLSDPEEMVGDVAAGLAAADVTVTATYTASDRHHNPIEPSAALARWEGDGYAVCRYGSTTCCDAVQRHEPSRSPSRSR